MPAETHTMTIPGPMLRRGFWLYVWRVETPEGDLLYVGRTGDNSSPHAVAPYQRMGQHLGYAKNQNALRRHLVARGIEPEDCPRFHLVSYGPIYAEVPRIPGVARRALMDDHIPIRDRVGAMEKKLADELLAHGYRVMNRVSCSWALDAEAWEVTRAAFAKHFPQLGAKEAAGPGHHSERHAEHTG